MKLTLVARPGDGNHYEVELYWPAVPLKGDIVIAEIPGTKVKVWVVDQINHDFVSGKLYVLLSTR